MDKSFGCNEIKMSGPSYSKVEVEWDMVINRIVLNLKNGLDRESPHYLTLENAESLYLRLNEAISATRKMLCL